MVRGVLLILLFSLIAKFVYGQLETAVQRGHSLAVRTVSFSPDGRYVASGSEDKTIKIWEFRSGREVKTLLGHQSQVNKVIFTEDGKRLISGGRDRNIFVWNLDDQEIIKRFTFPDESIVSLDLSSADRYLAVGTTKSVVRIIDLSTDSLVFEHKANVGQYGAFVRFSADGSQLAVGEDNRTVKVYDWQAAKLLAEIGESYGSCGGCDTQLAYLDDGHIIKVSRGSPLAKRDFKSAVPIQTYVQKTEARAHALVVNPAKSAFIIADEDSASLLDMATGRLLYTLDITMAPRDPKYGLDLLNKIPARTTDQFNDAAFSPDGKWLVTGDNSNLVTIWQAETGIKESVFYGYLSIPADDGLNFDPNSYWSSYAWGLVALKNKVQLSPDGKYAYRAKVGFEARKWDLATGKIVQTYYGHSQGVICFALSDDGKQLLTGSADNTVRLWNTESGEMVRVFSGHRGFIYSVAFSNDDTRIVSSGADGNVIVWDRLTGEQRQTKYLSGDRQKIEIGYEVKFSPNDLYIIVSYTHGAVKLIEIDTGREFIELIGHTAVVPSVAFLANGRQMISAGWDMSLRLWDIATGMQQRKFNGHSDPVQALDINKAGTRMVSGGTDRTILLWDVSTGKVLKRFTGHKSIITSVQFTPDEKRLVSSTIDGITKVWDIATGLEIITHFSIGSKDWLVTTSSGYFNGTGDARKQVYFVKGNETFSLDRFFDKYYNPEVIKNTFETPIRQDQKQGLLERLQKFPPPEVEITAPRPGEELQRSSIEVLARLKNEGGGLKTVSLILNGKVIQKKEEAYYAKLAAGKSLVQKFSLDLVPGLNTINVSATNNENIESRSSQVIINYQSKENQSVCYVLAIGINEYQNPALNLNYAYDDATAFTSLVREVSEELYERVEVHQLFNTEATKANILGILDILSQKIGPNDVFYLYYAGHGSMVEDEFYFIPTENTRLYSSEKLGKDGISATYLQQKLRNIQALKQMVLIDACQSGGSVELLAQRGAREEKAMAQLSRSAGIHVLSAAGSEQFATEYAEIGHGVFTYALLEALKGEADGAPEDGTVSIYELKSYIENMVPEYSQKFKGQIQYPYTFSKGQDFPVGLFKKR